MAWILLTAEPTQNITGFFILPGRTEVPFIYKVRRLRDGGIYCLRAVEVYQKMAEEASETRSDATKPQTTVTEETTETTDMAPCFTATVSFKRRENPDRYLHFRYQTPTVSAGHLRKTYGDVLDGRGPEHQPTAPGADAMWWNRGLEADLWEESGDRFPGVEVRKVDMGAFNAGFGNSDTAGRWRQLSFYRLITDDVTDINGDGNETSTLNLHACAHLYASDRNSLFLIARALDLADQPVAMSSLSHTVIFHADPPALSMCDDRGAAIWFLQEAWTENGGSNRASHESRLWRWQHHDGDGREEIVATTKQDGVIRVPADSVPVEEIIQQMKKMKKTKANRSGRGKL